MKFTFTDDGYWTESSSAWSPLRYARKRDARADFPDATFEHGYSLKALVAARLRAGAREYGDTSQTRPPHELLGELREEVADVMGWLHILKESRAHHDLSALDLERYEPAIEGACEALWGVLQMMEAELLDGEVDGL